MKNTYSRVLFVVLMSFRALPRIDAQDAQPIAEFLFIGSFHMNNPGRDIHNVDADDILSRKRQIEVEEVVSLLETFHPTKVMLEIEISEQENISKIYDEYRQGSRNLTRSESQQLGFRVASQCGLKTVYAVDWNDLGPIKDEESINYLKAVEAHNQQKQYADFLAEGDIAIKQDQEVLAKGTVLDMLKHLNSNQWLRRNAISYYKIGTFGSRLEPVGSNWVQYWFGRNLVIFNNIARQTMKGDRILVIYGAGHGNYLRQLATDSGLYLVRNSSEFLSFDLNNSARSSAH